MMEELEKNAVAVVTDKSSEKSGENENGWEDDSWGKDVDEVC